MNAFSKGTARRWSRAAVITGGAISLAAVSLGGASAEAASTAAVAKAAALGPDTPVSSAKNGKTTIGRTASAPASKATSTGFRGSARRADSQGVDYTRAFPKNVKRLDGGGLMTKDVIGADGRYQVTNTTAFPNRAEGMVTFKAPNGTTYGCTAYLYGNDTIGTAGKCVYFHDDVNNVHGWNTDFVFYPGKNGATNPYGSCGWTSRHAVNGWINGKDPQFAYAAVKLNCTIGNTTGWLGTRWQTASYNGTQTTVAGYPNDKPFGTVWQMSGPIVSSATRLLYYQIDTAGQSGAPVRDSGNHAIAINSVNASPNNIGTRITQPAFDNLITWKS